MSKIEELYGFPTTDDSLDWASIIAQQQCPYLGRKCLKIRKSQPELTIGTCTVAYGKGEQAIICPYRLLEKRQIFVDCLHLLTAHEPGNELHIISEVAIPGGNVDYVLVSKRDTEIRDFVGIELQALDTTGTLWPERQNFLRNKKLSSEEGEQTTEPTKTYGLNWKMTAKTILVQMHHKVETFEELDKHLVLVVQDAFFNYMQREFQFAHIDTARLKDSAHFHVYALLQSNTLPHMLHLQMSRRYSTDAQGIAKSLGLQALSKLELEEVTRILSAKISDRTRFVIG